MKLPETSTTPFASEIKPNYFKATLTIIKKRLPPLWKDFLEDVLPFILVALSGSGIMGTLFFFLDPSDPESPWIVYFKASSVLFWTAIGFFLLKGIISKVRSLIEEIKQTARDQLR